MTALTNNQSSFYLLDRMTIRVSNLQDTNCAYEIAHLIKLESLKPNSGLCIRTVHYLCDKIKAGKAVIAFFENELAGFCYIESWGQSQFIANSGLIVKMKFRGIGLARSMKKMIFELSKEKYPNAKFFGLTTNLGVMKINSELGYEPVTYSELTCDSEYWNECSNCQNYKVLLSAKFKNCLCTAFLYDPSNSDGQNQHVKFQRKFSLSNQEMKVFRLIIGGKRTSDIAEQLFVSKETVSSHRKRIIQKTSSKTPLDMYLLASKFQLTEL